MTGDLNTNESISFEDKQAVLAAAAEALAPAPALHRYGRLVIRNGSPAPTAAAEAAPEAMAAMASPTPTELLGRAAFAARTAPAYSAAKAARAHQDLSWGAEEAGGPQPIHRTDVGEPAASPENALAPLSRRMTGEIALGLVIVPGILPHLQFSQDEQVHVVAEVQNGLSWLADQSPAKDVTFMHDIKVVPVSVPEVTSGNGYEHFEAPWRDAALSSMGFPTGVSGARSYAEDLRTKMGTDWAYVAFFTKYRLHHFAYASIGGPRLVMHYQNDDWGPENIDRVFAHETGHIFMAPDEYGNCECGGSWGHFGKPNSNCGNCAPGGGEACIMRSNSWRMCPHTPYHLGFNGLT